MRFLILAHLNDDTALRIYSELRKRQGADNVRIVSNEELVFAPHWMHHLISDGSSTRVRLSDGTDLESDAIGVVLNRLRFPEMPHFSQSSETDRSYAMMEMHALLLSWLSSLPCPVINEATSKGLSGPERSLPEWMSLARTAGLPTRRIILSTDTSSLVSSCYPGAMAYGPAGPIPVAGALVAGAAEMFECEVYVVGDCLVGGIPEIYREGLMRLRDLSGCGWFMVTFSAVAAPSPEWKVSGVSNFLETCDPEVIGKVANLMELRERRR